MLFFNLHDWDDTSWTKAAEGNKWFIQPVSPGYPHYFREVIAAGARDICSHCFRCQKLREVHQFSLLVTQPAFLTLQQFRAQPMKWCLEYSRWVFLNGLAYMAMACFYVSAGDLSSCHLDVTASTFFFFKSCIFIFMYLGLQHFHNKFLLPNKESPLDPVTDTLGTHEHRPGWHASLS